jgi:ergothioneine biosynthesis protein EgtB
MNPSNLYPAFIRIRNRTLYLIEPLSAEDCCVQSTSEASPVKWHLAHTAWFFENFILQHYEKPFKPFNKAFGHMFSSYNKEGQTKPDSKRGLFTRPTLEEVRQYGHNIDERMHQIMSEANEDEMLRMLTILGMNHEQQHQELILADTKHLLSQNPLNTAYQSESFRQAAQAIPLEWHSFTEGVVEIGHQGDDFSYDNESPRHKHCLKAYQLASRLITNGEYLKFMESGGYANPRLWLSEGLDWVKDDKNTHPFYWRADEGGWKEFTLNGLQPLDLNLPVIHVSFYEADAFARWFGSRLPTEAEWENAAAGQAIQGCFADNNRFHPESARKNEVANSEILQLYGDAWEWTQSSYAAYPGYSPFQPDIDKPMSKVWDEAVGEYNSRSMVNQYVLRGGSCLIPQDRIRASFRHFLPAKTCAQVSGIRLARDSG